VDPLDIVNTCGAGDTFCAGLVHSILHPSHRDMLAGSGGPTVSAMQFAMKYAEKSLLAPTAVPLGVDLEELMDEVNM
jgi:sugar/nucleoside kinase (ribokinase family)